MDTSTNNVHKDMLIGEILEAKPAARRVMLEHFGEKALDPGAIMWEKLSAAAEVYGKDVTAILIEIAELED